MSQSDTQVNRSKIVLFRLDFIDLNHRPSELWGEEIESVITIVASMPIDLGASMV